MFHGGDRAAGGTSGCPKCRFATIATPTHNRHNQSSHLNGSVSGNSYTHLGYHHQQLKPNLMTTNHQHYGSNNSYSGEDAISDS